MAGIVVLCQAQMQQNSPDCQAPSLERCLPLHGMHWPATGGLTPPPAAKDTSCRMGDFLAEMVISHSENCVWEHAMYFKIMIVVNVLFQRWLLRQQGNRLRHGSCEGVSQLPTQSRQHTPFSLFSFPPSPGLPTPPYLNSSTSR